MQSLDILLIAGWVFSIGLCAIAIRGRKWPAAVAIGFLLATGATAVAIRESRSGSTENVRDPESREEEDYSYEGDGFRYTTSVLAQRFRRRARSLPKSMRVEIYQEGFGEPVSMTWAPGTDDIYVTERAGTIRVLDGRQLLDEPCATLPVATANGTDGLLGIELSPSFARDRFLYVYYTDREHGDNRVVRFSVTETHRCESPRTILSGIPAAGDKLHEGGQLEFSGGHLFVSTGEAGDGARSQATDDLAGKILRLRPDGSVPNENPFSDGEPNPVWSYGFRNPFGLAGGPKPSVLYATDNGPYCSDEIDHVVPGKNYGWGADFESDDCRSGVGDEPEPPIHRWEVTIAPTDLTYYEGSLPELAGLLVGDFNFGFLHHFETSPSGTKLRSETLYDIGPGYHIMDVAEGPGRWPYLVTTRDGDARRGQILRLVPNG